MTFRHLGQFFRFEASIQKDHQLIVSGLYAVVRHPGYTGMMLVFIGWVPFANEQRVLGYGVGVVGYDVGENARPRLGYFVLIFSTSYLLLDRMSKFGDPLRLRHEQHRRSERGKEVGEERRDQK